MASTYAQTQFLGCSVVNFSMNLGWGGETSTCTIKLAADYSAHWNSQTMAPIHNYRNVLRQRPGVTNKPSVTQSQAFNDHRDLEKDDKISQSLLRNVSEHESARRDTLLSDNRSETDPKRKDIGKKCWDTLNGTSSAAPIDWFDPDPGFIGNKNHFAGNADIDVVGCPSFFRFDNVWFGGMIKSWKYSDGTYDVQLGSFAPLLKGCKLVLAKYRGTISTTIAGTEGVLDPGFPLAVPYGDTSFGLNDPLTYKGTPYQGNIPNIFNIFGWLENAGFGASGYIEEKGMPAGVIYDTLVTFLNQPAPNHGPWSPYGAIVAKSPLRRDTAQFFNPAATYFSTDLDDLNASTIAFSAMGLIQTREATDTIQRSLLRLDLSNVPRPPNGVYINDTSMDILSFIEFCCSNAGVDFYIDFEPDSGSSNYSGVIIIRTVTRRVQPLPNTVKDYILNFDETDKVVEYNFGEEFNDTKSRNVLVGGQQQRLYQANTYTLGLANHRYVWEPAINHWVDPSHFGDGTLNNSFSNTFREPDTNSQRPLDGYNYKSLGGAAVAQINKNYFTNTEVAFDGTRLPQGSYFPQQRPNLGNKLAGSYPLFKDIISPYFGYGADGEPRNCYYDRKGRQMQVVINFRDIIDAFPVPYDTSVNAEWSPESAHYVSLFDKASNDLVGGQSFDTGQKLSIGYGRLVVGENEIRAAMSQDEGTAGGAGGNGDLKIAAQWLRYIDHRAQAGEPTAITQLLYSFIVRNWTPQIAMALLSGASSDQLYSMLLAHQANVANALRTAAIPVPSASAAIKIRSFNAISPQTTSQGLISMVLRIHSFLKDLGNKHYGKTFGVRIPNVVGYNAGGKINFSHEICDYAWEEAGNVIDSTMMVGTSAVGFFQDPQGKIGPILGFNNTGEAAYPPGMSYAGADLLWNQSLANAGADMFIGAINTVNYYSPIVAMCPEDTFINVPNLPIAAGNAVGGISADEINRMAALQATGGGTKSSHGIVPPNYSKYKTYVKATALAENPSNIYNPKIIYDNGAAKVVLSTPGFVGVQGTAAYHNDVLAGELLSLAAKTTFNPADARVQIPKLGAESPVEINGNSMYANIIHPGLRTVAQVSAAKRLAQIAANRGGNRYGFNVGSDAFQPRAAAPVFAAIPIKYNLMTYGPWVSHPGLIKNVVFPSMANNNLDRAMINNLVGGVNIDVNDSLVPWEYGGMTALDNAALLQVADNNQFQQVLEAGSITLAGIMLNNARIGQRLIAGDYAPIVTSINVTIGSEGINTRYELRTFSRKIGFYNKEASDNIKFFNQKFIQANQAIAAAQKAAISKATFVGNRLGGGY
tara:strand:+ start:3429 stop:7385 length:3957 start_codon:yes stop_codon:yes gene_type:complete